MKHSSSYPVLDENSPNEKSPVTGAASPKPKSDPDIDDDPMATDDNDASNADDVANVAKLVDVDKLKQTLVSIKTKRERPQVRFRSTFFILPKTV